MSGTTRPEWVEDLLDADLTDAEYRMLVFLKRVQGKHESSWYSLGVIAKELRRSESTVKRTIGGLVEKGRLKVEHPENQHRTKEGEPKLTNQYTVISREGVQKRTPSEQAKGSKSEPHPQQRRGPKMDPGRGPEMDPKYYKERILPQKKEHIYGPDSRPFQLAQLLRDRILGNQPTFAGGKDLQSWALEIDRMIRVHGRTPQSIEAVIEYAQADTIPRGPNGFCWAQVIRSGEKLKKHFDTIEFQMKGSDNGCKKTGQGNNGHANGAGGGTGSGRPGPRGRLEDIDYGDDLIDPVTGRKGSQRALQDA